MSGGIVGGNNSAAVTNINNCINRGSVSGGFYAGGIMAYNGGTLTIQNSHNEGEVTNTLGAYAGGILGADNAATNTTTITNSYNIGNVISNRSTDTATYTGGIIGRSIGTLTISDSYNEGEVRMDRIYTSNTGISYNGGIAGRIEGNSSKLIKNSYNKGNVKGYRPGGLVGYVLSTATLMMDRCYNTGDVYVDSELTTGNQVSSGLVSYNGGVIYILNSYNTGSVSVNNTRSQGIVYSAGSSTAVYVINSYNAGNVSGGSPSGIMYSATGIADMNNVFNIGITTGNSIGYFSGTYTAANSYYLKGTTPTNVAAFNSSFTPKTKAEFASSAFVTLLNNNKNGIDLSEYDLDTSVYSLCSWKSGSKGHPELNC